MVSEGIELQPALVEVSAKTDTFLGDLDLLVVARVFASTIRSDKKDTMTQIVAKAT